MKRRVLNLRTSGTNGLDTIQGIKRMIENRGWKPRDFQFLSSSACGVLAESQGSAQS